MLSARCASQISHKPGRADGGNDFSSTLKDAYQSQYPAALHSVPETHWHQTRNAAEVLTLAAVANICKRCLASLWDALYLFETPCISLRYPLGSLQNGQCIPAGTKVSADTTETIESTLCESFIIMNNFAEYQILRIFTVKIYPYFPDDSNYTIGQPYFNHYISCFIFCQIKYLEI